jgi:nucleoside-diphosphate-sugar epimerase
MSGWTPEVGLEDELHRTVDWYRTYLSDLRT